jgi:osmotically-inducible protein OsmY
MPETTQPILEEYVTEVRVGFRRPDDEIAEEVRNVLADDVGLDARAIHVEVKDGKVKLSGVVRTCADLRRAEGHACAVIGTTSVQSELQPLDTSEARESPSETGAAGRMGKPEYDF